MIGLVTGTVLVIIASGILAVGLERPTPASAIQPWRGPGAGGDCSRGAVWSPWSSCRESRSTGSTTQGCRSARRARARIVGSSRRRLSGVHCVRRRQLERRQDHGRHDRNPRFRLELLALRPRPRHELARPVEIRSSVHAPGGASCRGRCAAPGGSVDQARQDDDDEATTDRQASPLTGHRSRHRRDAAPHRRMLGWIP
jgi:hypothetical protein